MKLPMIIINRTGYSRNSDRLNNVHNEVKYEINSANRSYDLLTPVPIDISYTVTVVAKYPQDVDQIASNFIVFFNNDAFVSCVHPKYEGIKLHNQIVMSDSVSEEHPGELDGTADDFITSSFDFTFKTYLFGGQQQAKRSPIKTLSSYLSTFVEHNVIELKPTEIDDFQKKHPTKCVSVDLTSNVTKELTGIVENPDELVYDGFVPIINNIDVGFYPVPYVEPDIIQHMDNVDAYDHFKYDISSYHSSGPYQLSVQDNGLSTLVPASEHYEIERQDDTIMPFVDRLVWAIDESLSVDFPNNVVIR